MRRWCGRTTLDIKRLGVAFKQWDVLCRSRCRMKSFHFHAQSAAPRSSKFLPEWKRRRGGRGEQGATLFFSFFLSFSFSSPRFDWVIIPSDL